MFQEMPKMAREATAFEGDTEVLVRSPTKRLMELPDAAGPAQPH
jgi:hypothetical protein